ncbi:hypothetical protein Fot_57139 [Forsythia ovata]|uniref:Uncharacterized protein n=1 Tax=Forsythia ovata TaxID=205694 RepID=A0ABD1NX90_9LAMI
MASSPNNTKLRHKSKGRRNSIATKRNPDKNKAIPKSETKKFSFSSNEFLEPQKKPLEKLHKVESAENDCRAESVDNIIGSIEQDREGIQLEPNSFNCADDNMSRKYNIYKSESGKLDIIYSRALTVRDSKLILQQVVQLPISNSSGREYDYGNEDVVESVKEEKSENK